MERKRPNILTELSLAQVKKLVLIKERINALEVEKGKLANQLLKVDSELTKLFNEQASMTGTSARKTTRNKTRRARSKTAGRPSKKTVKKAAPAATGPKQTLEDVVISLISAKGQPVSFQDLLATITEKQLVQTRSAKFDNVLRRTLSTSKKIKRVSRGVYGV